MFIAVFSQWAKLRRSAMCRPIATATPTCRSYGAWHSFDTDFYKHDAPTELSNGRRVLLPASYAG